MLEDIKNGKSDYSFYRNNDLSRRSVNGGGQPIVSSEVINSGVDVKALRAAAIYKADKKSKLRKCHENPVIKTLYSDYFVKPNSHKAHEVLHTSYRKREKM